MPRAAAVQKMFAGIARRYDLLNRLLSLGIDRGWRRRTVRRLDPPAGRGGKAIDGPPPRVLDLCCGTGDLSLALSDGGFRVTGLDFCHEMLVLGRAKAAGRSGGPVGLAEGDALHLPFPEGIFSGTTVAFGVRNLEDLPAGLLEILRVLRPGGRLAVLEFGRPRGPVLSRLYHLYLNGLVPLVGRLVSGDSGAYSYLSTSIQGFPDQTIFPGHLAEAGYVDIHVEELTGGIANLYTARKPA